jgi:hypothetical protein
MSVVSRIPRALTGRIALVAAVAALLAACSSSAGGGPGAASRSTPAPVAQASDKYPNSIVVLGHSGTTGYDSDPKAPETDAVQNSWATGDNPAVDSIYLRLLALNPAARTQPERRRRRNGCQRAPRPGRPGAGGEPAPRAVPDPERRQRHPLRRHRRRQLRTLRRHADRGPEEDHLRGPEGQDPHREQPMGDGRELRAGRLPPPGPTRSQQRHRSRGALLLALKSRRLLPHRNPLRMSPARSGVRCACESRIRQA